MENKKKEEKLKKELILLFLMFSVIGCRKQWINTNIDGTILNEKPSVKDDFYQSVNYEKLKYYSPEKDNEFDILVEYISSMVKQNKSTDEKNSEKQKLIKLYEMSMDWEKRTAKVFSRFCRS